MNAVQNNLTPQAVGTLQRHLLDWFEQNQRDLPWRRTYDPYHVWISEIMLQQTQVKTVLPYFDRWIRTLPTISDVAAADEQDVLKLWEGLGYYSRARNLHRAAQIIAEKHNGRFPDQYEQILALPGIGRYTAGAIASIAFNQNTPIVDGNIIRLIARLMDYRENTRPPAAQKLFWHHAEQLIPLGKARHFNQAMMEFGALMCTPQSPSCGPCPLQSICKSYAAGTSSELPNRGAGAEKVELRVALAVIQKSNKIFIQQRPNRGLMGGLWEFPGGKIEADETPEAALHREIDEELGIRLKNVEPLMKIKHAYTKYLVDLHCFRADYHTGDITLNAAQDGKWVALEELSDYPFPAANVKLIEQLHKNHQDSR